MMIKNYLRIGDRRFALDEYLSCSAQITAALASAKHETKHALCLCTSPALKLQIRPSPTAKGERYFLAVWPGSRSAHNSACPFRHGADKSPALGTQSWRAVTQRAGRFHMKAGFPLHLAAGAQCPAGHVDPRNQQSLSSHSATQATMGLLGALQYLWEYSALHQYNPQAAPSWEEVHSRLQAAAACGSCSGRALQSLLHIIPPYRQARKASIEADWNDMLERHRGSTDRVPLFLVLGELRAKQEGSVHLIQLRHSNKLFCFSPALAAALAARYPSERSRFHRLQDDSCRVIGLFLVEARRHEMVWVHDAALMMTSHDYIPVDSSWEATLANHLAQAARWFEKPMRAAAGGLQADFILTDVVPSTVMEVFGMQTPEYLRRKDEKLARYREDGQIVWSWSPLTDNRIPPLPPRSEASAGATASKRLTGGL